MENSLSIADLRAALSRLLDALEDKFGPNLSPPIDYYWNVPTEAAFDLNDTPQLDMGQVSDDLESVREYALSPATETTIIWHESEHIAGLLRAIAFMDHHHVAP